MKIGFFTDTYIPQINGVVTSIETFKKQLEQDGNNVYIFAPTPKGKKDTKKIIRFPSMKFIFQPEMRVAIPFSQKAINLQKKINLDIIHSHDPFSIGLFGLWMARKFKIPYVHTYHTLYPEYVHYIWDTKYTNKLAKKLSRDFCNKCDTIIAPSSKIKNFLLSWGVKKPIVIIPTGIKLEDFNFKSNPLSIRKKYNIGKKDKLLIFVGRIAKEKNIEFLIKSLSKIKIKNTKLLIVGNGPHKKELENLVEKEKIKQKVIFTGYLKRKEVLNAYKASDIFVFSSKTETQGLVIAEAMAAGLPVVAVNDLAISDMVKNKKNGFLVSQSPQEIAEKIDILLKDKNLYKKMSEKSLELVKDLSIEKQSKKLENYYLNLIKNNSNKITK